MQRITDKYNFRYDKEADVLYASNGLKIKAKYHEIEDGVVLRIDPKTNNVVGFTIVNYALRVQRDMMKDISLLKNIKMPEVPFVPQV